jgi:hypothetical protein
MFAYCCNNPVTREDPDGEAFDTVFDILSLGASIADVISNPRDPWAWAGLAGDVIDVAVPFVTGVGEVTRAAKVAKETAEVVDDAHDAMKTVCAFGDAACFIAGTLVSIEDGYKAIEDVEAGDYVWAWDEETGEVALKQVVETYVRKSDQLIHIFVNGEEIITTPDHPFYVPVKGWTDAVNLRAGDILVLVNGKYVIVEKVQHEILEAPVTVYNFQVEDFHTYFVGFSSILVHNSNCGIEIPWSSNSVKKAASELRKGAESVTVRSRSEAEELFLGVFQGYGYTNTTGMGPMDVKEFFGSKAGTYHWDDVFDGNGRLLNHNADNIHGQMAHLQIHSDTSTIIRIFFGTAGGN